eukprot:TRINITY_DN2349_c0_g1_i1.p1 TRINITY_DN2349_c0_g1~~TRINITY_DN2349_c0_g1_i1.p1  ORF type:complete len:232 (+),score=53.71 TRINITY_DN2349_c0_g1_i1:66-761(+)
MVQHHRRNIFVLCALCAAAIQIFGFVGQEVGRQGQKQPWQLAQEHKEKLEQEQETASVRNVLPAQDASKNSLRTKNNQHREAKAKQSSSSATAFAVAHSSPKPVRSARRAEGIVESAADVPLQVPEANYFAMLDAMECIEEGCDLEWAEELFGKLKRDEKRMRLESMRAAAHLASAWEDKDVSWFRRLLRSVHETRQQLQAAMSTSTRNAAASLSYITFGNGRTGGVLLAH